MKIVYAVSLLVAGLVMLAFSAPASASKMDSRIELSARQSHVFKTYLKDDEIKIRSADGVVTLTGVVAESFHRGLAEETVAGLPGVKYVDNRLVTKGAIPTADSDAWLREKVKATLLFNRSMNARNIEVEVKDSVVTLRGEAASLAVKELATEYAKDVSGVKDVNNEMVVSNGQQKEQTIGQKIDDSSITAQVKMTLLYHRATSAINTKVETHRGVVSLYGKASSLTEVNLATKLANEVNGVRGVRNRMTIE